MPADTQHETNRFLSEGASTAVQITNDNGTGASEHCLQVIIMILSISMYVIKSVVIYWNKFLNSNSPQG